MAADEPAGKRARLTGVPEVLSPANMEPAAVRKLKESVATAAPYPHGLIRELCPDAFMRKVREEAITHLADDATFKETDLFKMYQTMDMANFSDDDPKAQEAIPSLLALRKALYSTEFRSFVQEVTGCTDLSGKTDMAVNIHTQGGHLLCHDDVIGDRAVSFIVYLVDPDETWTAADGGALELYPLTDVAAAQGLPAHSPSVTILPEFNAMAFFNVLPGASYHAVQEVLASHPRMSIQGWYHSDRPPPGADKASLQLLQRAAAEESEAAFPGEDSDDEADGLSDAELQHLRRFVTPSYLTAGALEAVATRFDDELSVQLREFLLPRFADALRAAAAAADAADTLGRTRQPRYDAGLGSCSGGSGGGGSWQLVGPPIKQRYLRLERAGVPLPPEELTPTSDLAEVLSTLKHHLFESEAFRHFLQVCTGCHLHMNQSEVRRFRAGLDYTVAHHGQLSSKSWLSSTLCIVDDAKEANARAWQSEEVGGFECFLNADKDGEAATAEVYRAEGDDADDLLTVCAVSNTLNVVLRGPARMHFAKYVSACAPGSRWDIWSEFHVAPENEDSEDDEDGEDAAGEGDGEEDYS